MNSNTLTEESVANAGVEPAREAAASKTEAGFGRLGRWIIVSLYAVGMAWVEAAVVFYLRTLVDRIEPYQANPLPSHGALGGAELVREAATLLMLLTVGMLAGKTWRARIAYSAIAFGVWDIFYYAFLKVMTGWPHSLLDWDVLFLLPLPWWGPALAPMLIAVLMIVWGTLVTTFDEDPRSGSASITCWGLNGLGISLALCVFMKDALKVASQGEPALRNVLPQEFDWLLFGVALALMAAPIFQIAVRIWRRTR